MRKLPILFLLAAPLLATPALAEVQPQYDPHILDACLADKGKADPAACIGKPSEACMATPQGDTTQGMVMCLDVERSQWDSRLNAAYERLMAKRVAADQDAEAAGISLPMRSADALRAAQRAWLAWRDAECSFAGSLWQGGTGAALAGTECVMRLTGERAVDLEAQIEDAG